MQASRRLPVGAVLGAAVLAVLFVVTLLGKSAAPYDPEQVSDAVFQPPSGVHLLGTNDLGQDVFSELVTGTRLSLFVGISVATLSTALAWSVGLLAGYAPGGDFIMAASDLLLAIPALPLLVLLVAYGGGGLTYIIAAMGLLSWPAFGRIVRSQVLSTRERDYVIAAYAAGATPPRVVIRHILPETVPIIATKLVLTVAGPSLSKRPSRSLDSPTPRASVGGTCSTMHSVTLFCLRGALGCGRPCRQPRRS